MSWLGSIFAPGAGPDGLEQPPQLSRPPSPSKLDSLPPYLRSAMEDFAWPARSVVRVAVLLDGDNDFFSLFYLSKGYRGGRTAALDLRSKVHAAVIAREREMSGGGASFRPPEVHMMAKVFLDVAGQASKLQGVDLPAFIQGFNSNGVLAVSMADVGSLRGAADEAIKGHLPFFLSACDLILLGSTQDGAYASDLLRLDPTVLQEKVALVRTPRCAERVLELELQEVSLPGLFEGGEKVEELKPAPVVSAPQPFPFTFGANPSMPISQIFGAPSPALSRTSSLAPPPPISPPKVASPAPSQETFSEGFFSARAPSPTPPVTEPPATQPASPAPAPATAPPPTFASSVLASTPASAAALAPSPVPKTAPPPQVAQSTAVPTPTAPTSPPSPERRPALARKEDNDAYFRPLLAILRLFHDQQDQPRPRRADVGQRLKQRFPEFKNRSFGEYAKEAEKRGLVVLGKGDKIGGEWIARKGHEGAGEERTRRTRQGEDLAGMMDGLSLSPSKKAGASSAPPVSAAPPPPPPPPPHPYQFLLTFLLSQTASGKPRPLRSFVGDQLRKANIEAGPGKWLFDQASKEGLREYLTGAEKEGWVRFGRGDGVGAEWVELVDLDKTKAHLASPPPQPEPASAPPSPPTTRTARPTARPIPPHILPLLRAIDTCKFPVAHWTSIGAMLNRAKPRPYEEGGFKAYVLQAEKDKWIETWKIEEKEGMYGMRLSEFALKALAAHPTESTTTSSSTSASPVRQKTYTPSAPFDGHLPPKFCALVAAIRAQPVTAPHWTNVGGVLNKIRPRVYEEGGFKAYVMEAVKAGIIRTGRVEDKENMYWMKLTPAMADIEVDELELPSSSYGDGKTRSSAYRSDSPSTTTYEVDSSTVPVADHIPSRFLPLLRAIVSVPFLRPFYSQVGYELNKMDPKPYGPHAESATVREYVEEAVLLGLVDRGKGAKTGQDWIAVKTGLELPPDLQALRAEATASRPSAPAAAPAPPVGSLSLFPPLPGNAPSVPKVTTSPIPAPAFSPSPIISSTPSFSPFPPSTASSTGPIRVPPDVLARWRPLATFDPFAPLVITLRYLLDSHSDPSPSLSKLRSVLEQFPAESLPGGGSSLEKVIRAGGGAEGEGLFGYVAKAQREGVVQIGAEGVALKEPWTSLDGLS